MSAVIIVFLLTCIFSALMTAHSGPLSEAMVSGGKKLYAAAAKWIRMTSRNLTIGFVSRNKKVRGALKRFRKMCHDLWMLGKLPEVQENNEPSKGRVCQTKDDDPWQ